MTGSPSLRILIPALLLGCAPALLAQTPPPIASPSNTDASGVYIPPAPTYTPPAAQQTPDYTQSTAASHAESRKPFTVSATVRETYDDNIYTAHTGQKGEFTTTASPSLLFSYPMEQTLLSARETFGATYYPDRHGSSFDLSNEFLGRINHSFSDRFNLDVRDRVLYSDQPQTSDGAVVNRVNGSYIDNTFTAQGTAQWLPKLNTVTTYTNDYIHYDDATQALSNDNNSNTLQHDFRFLMSPTLTLAAGGIFNDVSYTHSFIPAGTTSTAKRDWTSYTAYVGPDYNLSPEVLVGARLGGVLSTFESINKDITEPYANAFVNWQTSSKTNVDFSYTHTAGQTSVSYYANAIVDTFSISGLYQITPKLAFHIQGNYAIAKNEASTSLTPGLGNFHENTLGLDTALGYDLTKYLNLNLSYSYTEVISEDSNREYDRNQISLGVTATY